ncbi:TadE/TadG family type IV pilus assembly protein [Paraburkholderia antibiotica]|uniref:Pilus assembly protein n=1 Tax=Paraburkholderia antibiotica TaxID=2728839 RepID=A0A7X9X7S3_9BURK|nr:TadE/TadG family type IV pilus assembly protein [Paraburkholderia antibiotica]NML32517.1 pilus assembly protein [Paraburkholderia antibiotica]
MKRLKGRARMATRLRRQRGVAAVEFALVAPMLLLIAIGVAQFGWLLGNYVMVANAASAGARYFASQRGTSTPYSTTQSQVSTSAALLNTSNLSIATAVNGVACSSDSSCATSLTSAGGTPAIGTATVTVTYTFAPLFKGSLSGLYAMMPTALNASAVERVQ